jgi:hypothetical protein
MIMIYAGAGAVLLLIGYALGGRGEEAAWRRARHYRNLSHQWYREHMRLKADMGLLDPVKPDPELPPVPPTWRTRSPRSESSN